MTHKNLPDQRSKHSILSNVFSFVSREIGEFVTTATHGVREVNPSKRKRARDGRLKETEERARQRRGYDGRMIQQWRDVSDSVHDPPEKKLDSTHGVDNPVRDKKDRRKMSIDGKRRASSGSPSRSQSAQPHTRCQSQSSHEPPHSRTKKTNPKSCLDGKQPKARAKSADGYGRKKSQERLHAYVDQPEDADGELTPSTTSCSPSPQRNNPTGKGEICSHPQEQTPSYTQDTSLFRENPPPLNTLSTFPSRTFPHPDAAYPPLSKKPSITMPGSLFPRSDSLEVELNEEENEATKVRSLSASHDARDRERNPNHNPDSGLESEPGPSTYQNATPANKMDPSPWRIRPIASVRDALTRFTASGGEERDFSLLVAASPADPVRPESLATALERSHSPLSGISRKGKERAVAVSDEDGDEDLAFILDNNRVQDKEKQLDAARREKGMQSITMDDGEREKDKERIRLLEQEVRLLKEELSRHRHSSPHFQTQTQTQVPIPPPPPPLPPPPGVRIPLLTHLSESGSLFASARAALRPTEVGFTGSTTDIVRTGGGKMRQPTVNIPSEKMAAFLNEMKTVRLRKVGPVGGLSRSISDRPMGDRLGPSGLSRSVSAIGAEGRRAVAIIGRKSMGGKALPASSLISKSAKPSSGSAASNVAPGSLASAPTGSKPAFNSKTACTSTASKYSSTSTFPPTLSISSSVATELRIGNKRKADILGEKQGGSTSKRHSGPRAQIQSDTSTSSCSRTHGATHSNSFLAGSSLTNHSSLSNETDITTPSLCSDNELGGDADGRMPSTPPGPRTSAAQVAHEDSIEIIDVDMEDMKPSFRPITPSRPPGEMFRKRLPISPLPAPTPRKPRAPARLKGMNHLLTPERTKRGATPKPKGIMLLDEEEEEEEEEDELALPPRLMWKGEASVSRTGNLNLEPTMNVKGKRRLTLDEELARARSSDRLAELEVESGELVGLGTGSTRRGFLAGGGAGGVPVFMGAGYVQGAEEDGLVNAASRIPRRKW